MTVLLRRAGAATSFSLSFAALGNQSPMLTSQFSHGLADGLDWQNFQITGGVACAAAFSSSAPPPYDDSLCILKTSAFTCTANQFCEITIKVVGGYTPPGTHELGVFVRGAVSAHSMTGYESYRGFAGAHTLVRWNGAVNDFTPLFTGSPPTPQDGDIWGLEAIGTTVTAYYIRGGSRTNVSSGTDTTYSSGQPGMQSYVTSGGTPASYSVTNFRCGNL